MGRGVVASGLAGSQGIFGGDGRIDSHTKTQSTLSSYFIIEQ